MKQRFSSIDAKIIAQELGSVESLRISNIYDLSSRIFIFRLAKPDVRKQLVVDVGFRCHLTTYSRTTADTPSHFVSRLRKFLKTRRITRISQVGTDRIIHLELSDGAYHLFLEFFSAGNIILTDSGLNIVALQRVVPPSAGQEEAKVGSRYNLEGKQNFDSVPVLSEERLKETLATAPPTPAAPGEEKKQKKEKNKINPLRKALFSGFPEYPPLLLQHAFHVVGFDASIAPEQVLADSSLVGKVMEVLREAKRVVDEISDPMNQRKGFIICKKPAAPETQTTTPATAQENKGIYEDYHPFLPAQFSENHEKNVISYQTFTEAVDEYYSSVEAQRLASRFTEREQTARRKLENARKDHERRVGALVEVQAEHMRKADAIMEHMTAVEQVSDAINSLIGKSMGWEEIAGLIEQQQQSGNPIAQLVKLPLQLEENTATIVLPDPAAEELGQEEEDEDSLASDSSDSDDDDYVDVDAAPKNPKLVNRQLTIDIDLGLTAGQNAKEYYGQKKAAAAQAEKTIVASGKAFENQQKKVNADLKRGLQQEKPLLRHTRDKFWFEKFLFFISSDGYLVLGGTSVQQSEFLYKKHLRYGDIFVHSDIDKALPVVIKNNPKTPNAPIPPTTLSQAGAYCAATSAAWDSKGHAEAWWVDASQVSKTMSNGEVINTDGRFDIKGEKRHLPPTQLVLGFAVLWQIGLWEKHTDAQDANADAEVDDAKSDKGNAEDKDGSAEAENITKEDGSGSADDGGEHTSPPDSAKSHEKGDEEQGAEDDKDKEDETNVERPKGDPEPDVPETSASAAEVESSMADLELSETPAQAEVENKSVTTPETKVRAQSQASFSAQQLRGKKGKQKKIASKYRDQDEEERQTALELLGSAASKKEEAKAASSEKIKEQQADQEAQRRRHKEEREQNILEERKRSEWFQSTVDGKDADERSRTEDMSMLSILAGTCPANAEVTAAIPVCAPYSALGKYQYRTKLQPGPLKKGKAVREMIGKWITQAQANAKTASIQEKEKVQKDDGDNEGGEDKQAASEDTTTQEGAAATQTTRAESQSTVGRTELDLLQGWKDVEVMNTIPVGTMRIVAAAGDAGGDKGKGGQQKGKKWKQPAKGGKQKGKK